MNYNSVTEAALISEYGDVLTFAFRTTILTRLVLGEFAPLQVSITAVHDEGANPFEGEHKGVVDHFYRVTAKTFVSLVSEYPDMIEAQMVLPFGQFVEYTMTWNDTTLEEEVLPVLRRHELPEVRALHHRMVEALSEHDPERWGGGEEHGLGEGD